MPHLKEIQAKAAKLTMIACVLLNSACANYNNLVSQDAQTQGLCMTSSEHEFPCPDDGLHSKDPHPEYNQQLLPVYQREDVLNAEIEAANNTH
ncbi:hypothetical protein [Glaciecola sp. SC05]|uniref:hypothetical protein n=1 Tax=Glaciecola sp. SC05 TaxID=1987355 RepID=UPI0035296742